MIEPIQATETSFEHQATPDPQPHGNSRIVDVPHRPSVLSAYAPVNSGDNPLAIREVRKTGAITWVAGREGWCVNPSTSFPLTVVGTDEETVRQIREALDGLVDHYSEDISEAVGGIMVERGARFQEFEQYLGEQRRVYRLALGAAQSKRAARKDGQSTSEEDDELEDDALDALDGCCHDFAALIDGDYPSDPGEIAAIRKFGFGNLMRYLGTGPDTVKTVPSDHRKRIGLDALVQAGLAIPCAEISAIPTSALLHAMTAKELQALSLGPIPSRSRKKHLAVEFLLAQSGIRERAVEATTLDSAYYLVPAQGALAGFDLRQMHERMGFALSVANLLVTTYLTAALAPTNREYEGKHLARERFKVHNIRDILTCRTCLKADGQSKPLAEWTRFPLHFGCRCSLLLDGR